MTKNKKKQKKEKDIEAKEADFTFSDDDKAVTSVLGIFGVNYEDLAIKDKIVMGESTNLNIEGITQDGLRMSDSTISIVTDSESSSVDLKMNIPEVSYTDFESTIFTFNNLDLFVLPSSDPQSLEFSADMDSLEIITEKDYVNLKDLNLFFKSYPDENGICLDIDIGSFIYPDFNGTSFSFEDLGFNLAIGLDGQKLDISVNLPKLHLINKNYRVNLTDLELNVALPDLNLSNLDLSILMSDFHYTNFEDVNIDMDDLDVSLEPIPDSTTFKVNIGMSGFNLTGINSFEELFPMLNIDSIRFKNFTDDSKLPVTMTGSITPLDVTQLDLVAIGALLASGFDLDTYMNNMSSLYTLDEDADSGAEASGFDLVSIFENFDYSSLNSIVLNLSTLTDSLGIDLNGLGVDLSGYDLSAISVSDLIDAFKDSGWSLSAIQSTLDLATLSLENADLSGLISSFDTEKFDLSALLGSLNLEGVDIAGILDLINDPDFDLSGIFDNIDSSSLDAIVIDLTALIGSLGIDLSEYGDIFAELGIDLSGYDLSAISLSDLLEIFKNSNIDMSTITVLFKLLGLDLDDIDFSGLIASFDAENFDLSSLLASLNLSDVDLSAIVEMFNNPDFDFAAIFENIDLSCLSAIELDLTGLIATLGVDLSGLGIDFSDYNPAAITMSDLIDIFRNSDFDMSEFASNFDLSDIDFENLDVSGLIASFDTENFDMTSLINSLDLSGFNVSGMMDMFNNSGVDFAAIFENVDLSCLGAIELNLTGVIVSTGIDLSELEGLLANFGIDLSGYDLSAISLSEIIGIIMNSDFDMSAIASMIDLSSLGLGDLDLDGLIASFDAENFDMNSLLNSLNLSGVDFSAMADKFSNLNIDFEGIFENFDYSCLDSIVIDLTKLIDSLGINLSELCGLLSDLGVDLSGYDLSAITVSDLIDVFKNSDFDMSIFDSMINLFSLDFEDIDLSGFVVSYDLDELDIEGLLASLNVPGVDISGILEMLNSYGFDLTEFMNQLLASFTAEGVPEVTGADE